MHIDIEVRPFGGNRCLVLCPDGSRHVLGTAAAKVASALTEAVGSGDMECLGAPLRRLLQDRGAIRESAQGGPRPGEPMCIPEDGELSRLVLCGSRDRCHLLSGLLATRGVMAQVSDRTPREVAYDVFRGGLEIVVAGDAPVSELVDQTRSLEDLGVSWLPVWHDGASVLVGPMMVRGSGATLGDALIRARSVAPDLSVAVAEEARPVWGDLSELSWACTPVLDSLADLMAELAQENTAEDRRDTVWEIALDGAVTVRAVLPTGWVNVDVTGDVQAPRHPATFVVDHRFGIVRTITPVRHSSYMPPRLHTVQARTADLRRVSPYVNSVFCQGSVLDTGRVGSEVLLREATGAAVGESVERYCSNLTDLLPLSLGSYEELRRRGMPAVDPTTLVLFSREQYAERGFPFVPFTRQTRVSWVWGRHLDDGSDVLVPASLVYVNWRCGRRRAEPPTNFHPFAGVAAGASKEQAIRSCISEILERHATMVWWLNRHPLAALQLSDQDRELFAGARNPLRPVAISVDNVFDVPVIAGVVHDDQDCLVHVGFSCRPTVREATLKAWTEALTLQEGARDLMNPDGAHWTAIRQGLLPGRSYKSWRADRRYLDDFRADLRDVDDLLVQQEVFLDPRSVSAVADMLDLPETRDPASCPALGSSGVDGYLSALETRGLRAIAVDITSPDVRSCGMSVMRVVVPGTVGNTPAAFPYLGGDVVQQEAVELGWRDEPMAAEQINRMPLPHA